jgi:hypothetical protein
MGVEKGSLVTVCPFTTAYVSHSKGVERGWVGCRKTGKPPSVSPEWVLKVKCPVGMHRTRFP